MPVAVGNRALPNQELRSHPSSGSSDPSFFCILCWYFNYILLCSNICMQITRQYGMHCCVDSEKVVNGAAIERLPFAHSRTLCRPPRHPAGSSIDPVTSYRRSLLSHLPETGPTSRPGARIDYISHYKNIRENHLETIHHVDQHLRPLDRIRAANLQRLGVPHTRRRLFQTRAALRAVVQRSSRPRRGLSPLHAPPRRPQPPPARPGATEVSDRRSRLDLHPYARPSRRRTTRQSSGKLRRDACCGQPRQEQAPSEDDLKRQREGRHAPGDVNARK